MDKLKRLNMDYVELLNNSEMEVQSSIMKLASFGWTVPLSFTQEQLLAITHSDFSAIIDEQVNEAICDIYCKDNHEILAELINVLKGKLFFHDWNPLLDECFQAFKQGLYSICCTALIPIVEGSLIKSQYGTANNKNIQVQWITTVNKDKDFRLLFHKNNWASIEKVILKLFEKSNFELDEPELNRHWVVHGRSAYKNGRTASLKLFNLLGTISLVLES